MKIAWLHSHFYYWMGGTKFIFEVAKRLKKRNKIEIFIEKGDKKIIDIFRRENIPVTEVGLATSNSLIYWLFFPFFARNEIKKLEKLLNKGNFNVALSTMFPMNYIASKIKGIKKTQYVYEPFIYFHDKKLLKRIGFPKNIFIKILKFMYGKYDIKGTQASEQIFTLGKLTQKQIKDIYKKDSIVTYEGVDTKFFFPRKSKLYSGKKVIVHSTDFTQIKKTDLLIKSLPKVIKVFPNTVLLITNTINNNKEKKKLVKLAKNLGIKHNVKFLGHVSYKRIPVLYSRADIVVQPSLNQSQNFPVKEAMACGTPVIRAPEYDDEVEEGKNGFRINPFDTKKMAEKIIYIFTYEKKAEKMGKYGRKKVKDMYNWNKVANLILKGMKQCVKKH